MSGSVTPCEYARMRHLEIARWANLWKSLVYGLGCALALLLISSVFLWVFVDWAAAAVAGAGTVASGAATLWLVGRLKEAVREEKAAYEEVKAACVDTQAADEVRRRLGLSRG